MARSELRMVEGLRFEEIGDGGVVFDSTTGTSIHRLNSDGVAALRLVIDGDALEEIPEHLRQSVAELVEAGVVSGPFKPSRRKLLLAGGTAWAAATVTTFALADPAAAGTPCTDNPPTNPQQQKYTANGTFITGQGVTSIKVRVWGAGGGGGGGRYDGTWSSGSGGGGGAYAYTASVTVTPCTPYSVTVGAGGAGGARRTAGSSGGDSWFGSSSTVMAKGGAQGLGANGGNPAGGIGGQASASLGVVKYSGGNGGKGGDQAARNDGGGGGGGAGAGGAGGNGGDWNEVGGAGGSADSGVSGSGGGTGGSKGSGFNGDAPGGGGCGGYGVLGGFLADHSTSGGNGARGQVWIGY